MNLCLLSTGIINNFPNVLVVSASLSAADYDNVFLPALRVRYDSLASLCVLLVHAGIHGAVSVTAMTLLTPVLCARFLRVV
jgi:hypothetical protein